MFQVHDYVVYGSTGVCQIVDISQENFGGNADREYYILNPVYGNSMQLYIPTDHGQSVMRRVLSKEEIIQLIQAIPAIDSDWISDDHFRKATFSETLQSGDQKRIIHMIKMINNRKISLEKNGKHLANADCDAMKVAEKLLHNEFGLVLGLQPDQVAPFIMEHIPAKKVHSSNN